MKHGYIVFLFHICGNNQLQPGLKKLTNMCSSTSDATITLRPPRLLSLDQSIEFIAEDEVLEITPQNVRISKMVRDRNVRGSGVIFSAGFPFFLVEFQRNVGTKRFPLSLTT